MDEINEKAIENISALTQQKNEEILDAILDISNDARNKKAKISETQFVRKSIQFQDLDKDLSRKKSIRNHYCFVLLNY